jgi:hypothetical protein
MRIDGVMVALALAGALTNGNLASAQVGGAQMHIGHILDNFKDTPNQAGLLPAAFAEAKIAQEHAGLAAKTPDNLEAMKLHAGHVIHAVDPTVAAKGPGQGYGVKKAAAGVAQHAELAGKAEGASKNVQTQATYVAAWANNVVKWSDEVVDLAKRVQAATAAPAAAELVTELNQMVDQLLTGVEAVGRFQAQGGLKQAQERMDLLKKGESR